MKEHFSSLTFLEKEALIIALLYLTKVSGKKYTFEVKESERLYTVIVDIGSQAETEYLNRIYGAAIQYYNGYYSHHFAKFSIKETIEK